MTIANEPRTSQNRKLSVLMPVYNESRTLREIVGKVFEVDLPLEIELICVDDHSVDDSYQILQDLATADGRIRVFRHDRNRGKGMAIRTAIEEMTGDLVIIQDADLEYDPQDYHKVLAPLLDGRADVVYGSRFASSEQRRVLMFWHSLGNKVLTTLSNMFNDLNLTDMETCYKAFRADLLKSLRLTSERFGFEPEVTARLAQWGARIYEVPISYHGRTYAEGKNIGWKDGVEALWLIVKFRFWDNTATDDASLVTRQSLLSASRTSSWTLDPLRPYLGDEVLEVGSGPGHLTSQLLGKRRLVTTDVDATNVETLKRRFGHLQNFTTQHAAVSDLSDRDFDSVVLFDELQRSESPEEVLKTAAALVRPGGHVLIRVPADQRLFGPADLAAGHLRRFELPDVEDLFQKSGLNAVYLAETNKIGVFGWRIHHALGRRHLTASEVALFDSLVPLWKIVDRFIPGRGLSIVAAGQVPE